MIGERNFKNLFTEIIVSYLKINLNNYCYILEITEHKGYLAHLNQAIYIIINILLFLAIIC